jgi:chromosome segregation ATPase
MSDITELERRIIAALERIGQGLDGLERTDPDRPDPAEMEGLREALESERSVNAQLNERVKAIRERQETQVARLEQRVADLKASLEALESELEQFRAVNIRLRETSAALRAANAEGLGDAGAIDAAMQAEIESLMRLRASDRAELDAILAELAPLAEGGATHA